MKSDTTTLTKTMIETGIFLKRFNLDNRSGLIFSFVFGFVLRLIPEVLSFPHPIGFDTVSYAGMLKSGIVWHHWTSVFSGWLFNAILVPVYEIVQGDPFLLLKLVAPILYALNVCGVYYFSKKALGWTARKGIIAALFFAFQLASLRLSWDLYRNMLGIGILLFTLPWIPKLETKREFSLFILLSILVVFSHEYASAVMLAVILGIMIKMFLKDERKRLFGVSVAVSPALALFLTSVYLKMFPVSFRADPNVIAAYQPAAPPGGLFFLIDYLNPGTSSLYYPTYVNLASHFFSLFAILYLLCLPLVFVGFFRERFLDGWTGLLLVGSFSSLITPFFALIAWYRWMLMLVYPLTFYAVNGIARVLHSTGESVTPAFRMLRWVKLSRREVKVILAVSFSLGLLFVATPLFFGRAGLFDFPTTTSYLPSSMMSNTVPVQDVNGVVEAMKWLDVEMDDSSVLLVHSAFGPWTELHLNSRHFEVYFRDDIEGAIDVALGKGFGHVYLVWWNENIGWYGLSVPKDFVSVFSSGRISVFEHRN